jgi:antitoxin ParD1/3/4
MVTLTVSVPEHVKEWIDEKIRTGDYVTSGDYFVELIERDRAMAEMEGENVEDIRRIIAEARTSGVSTRSVQDIFEAAVERARADGTLRD